jgi:hypothetical protein
MLIPILAIRSVVIVDIIPLPNEMSIDFFRILKNHFNSGKSFQQSCLINKSYLFVPLFLFYDTIQLSIRRQSAFRFFSKKEPTGSFKGGISMLQQISIFTANQKGALSKITAILEKNNINIYTMLATDSAEFGIVRLITDDAEKSEKALKDAGYQCRLDCIIAVDMASDKPGTLNHILADLNDANVMIRYLYISFDRQTGTPIAVFNTNDSETETFLRGKGYKLLDTL